jgi:hypothetical protein
MCQNFDAGRKAVLIRIRKQTKNKAKKMNIENKKEMLQA